MSAGRDMPGSGPPLVAAPRSTLKRRPQYGHRDRATIEEIIDQSLVCHVGFVDGASPVVVPACPWRIGDWLYLHGAAGSRLIERSSSGAALCVSMALVDALVLARAALRHSLHYRSVVLFGHGEAVADPAAKATALSALIEKLSPGRSGIVRPPTDHELAVTGVARLRIEEGGAKVAASPPSASQADDEWRVWAGTVPLQMRAAAPIAHMESALLLAPALPAWLEASDDAPRPADASLPTPAHRAND